MDNNTLRIGIGIESIALVEQTEQHYIRNKINNYNGEKAIVFGLLACRNDNDNENDVVVLLLFLYIVYIGNSSWLLCRDHHESIALVQQTDHPFRSNKINKYNGEKSIVFGLSACQNDNEDDNDLLVLMLFLCIGIESIALVEQTDQHYIRNKVK